MDEWDRRVPFEACFNFRDLGGYATRDGRSVCRGVLYRSDSLHRLSPDDLAVFTGLYPRCLPPHAEALWPSPPPGRTGSLTHSRLLRKRTGPVVFHCMAGKDRTGVLAGILLSVLDVPDETIAADYTLTNESLAPALAWARVNDSQWTAWLARVGPTGLLDAPAQVIVEFLELLRTHYGTIGNYLADAGLRPHTLEVLRDRYLA